MGNGRYLTLEEAALEVNKKVSWIKKRVWLRELDAKFEGGRWLVSAECLHKIAPATSSPKAETTISHSLTLSPSRKAPAEMKPTAQEGSAHETMEAPKPTKKSNKQVSGSKGERAEPNPSRREAIGSRIKALDKKIARFGDLLCKEMLEHGPVGDGYGPEAYGKTAEKLRRVWQSARVERVKLALNLENLGESGRAPIGSSSSNAPNEETDRRFVGGIDGYYDARREMERRHSSTGEATSDPRLLILRRKESAYARVMQDKGQSSEARKAAAVSWAQARREAEVIERELRDAPMQVKGVKTERTAVEDRPSSSKAKNKTPASPRRTPSNASSKKPAVRATGKGKYPSTPRDAASDHRDKTAHEISQISRRVEEKGFPAPLGDPASGIVLVVEQPVTPRVLQALKASLRAVKLPEAYVTYASTGLLREALLTTEPHALIAVGAGGARDIDAAGYPLARQSFSEAEPGVSFSWTEGTLGLLLPSLVPALDDEAAKRLFWRAFLSLKDLVAPSQSP